MKLLEYMRKNEILPYKKDLYLYQAFPTELASHSVVVVGSLALTVQAQHSIMDLSCQAWSFASATFLNMAAGAACQTPGPVSSWFWKGKAFYSYLGSFLKHIPTYLFFST